MSKRSIDENDDSDDEDNQTGSSKKRSNNDVGRNVIVILDQATLETVKTRKGDFQLLNW